MGSICDLGGNFMRSVGYDRLPGMRMRSDGHLFVVCRMLSAKCRIDVYRNIALYGDTGKRFVFGSGIISAPLPEIGPILFK